MMKDEGKSRCLVSLPCRSVTKTGESQWQKKYLDKLYLYSHSVLLEKM